MTAPAKLGLDQYGMDEGWVSRTWGEVPPSARAVLACENHEWDNKRPHEQRDHALVRLSAMAAAVEQAERDAAKANEARELLDGLLAFATRQNERLRRAIEQARDLLACETGGPATLAADRGIALSILRAALKDK